MVRPGMNDGRMFTNYDSSCKLNEDLKKQLMANDSNDYRRKLQTLSTHQKLKQ